MKLVEDVKKALEVIEIEQYVRTIDYIYATLSLVLDSLKVLLITPEKRHDFDSFLHLIRLNVSLDERDNRV